MNGREIENKVICPFSREECTCSAKNTLASVYKDAEDPELITAGNLRVAFALGSGIAQQVATEIIDSCPHVS